MPTDPRPLFDRARHVLPGGVNSPVRAFRNVGGTPVFVARGDGARVWDEDGREYIDFVGAWGPLLFGHAFPPVVDAVRAAAGTGVCFGAPTRLEVDFAETFVRLNGWLEQVRVTNSGTEATMTAARLVRAATGRPSILTFDGGYHGHGDAFLVPASSPSARPDTNRADSPVVLATFNDLDSVAQALDHSRGRVAGVFVEPVCANVGVIAPAPGFLAGLRRLCDEHGTLLVFDEVVTGGRLARGGAAEYYRVRPDLATYGKVVGGGLPIGAVGGPRALMSLLAPEGPVAHAGTFCGNPMSMAAGLAQLRAIEADATLYERLETLGARLERGVAEAARAAGVACTMARVGSMWTLYFTASPVAHAAAARASETARFATFFHAALSRGVSLAPSALEACFVSAAHTEADIDIAVGRLGEALASLA